MTTITFSAIGSNSARKWQVLLSARIFCCAGLDAQMPERRLVERLHALARHGDADAADGQQRHGPEIDLAPAGHGPGGAHLAVAEPGDAEGAAKGRHARRAGAPAERDRDVGALARRMRGGRGLARRTDSRPPPPARRGGPAPPARPWCRRWSRSPDCPACRRAPPAATPCARSPSPRARRRREPPSARRTRARAARSRASSASAARSAACLAPGMRDHGRPAPVEIGGREAGEVREVDQLALGHHRAGDHAPSTARPACTGR